MLVAAGVVAILALGALLQFGRSSPAFSWRPAPRIRSIAVLPFRNLSGDATHDYLSEGMTEEITTDLARFVSLRVVSATSARHYGEKEPSLEEIARELKVDAIVEGSVTISGGRVRVNAQLVDTKTDTHLWAQVYDRNADEIAEVHDLIASEVVHHVAGNPSPAELESVERILADR